MAKIAFILLCHKDPEAIIAQAERLTATGDVMAIHFDANASQTAYRKLRDALDENDNVVFARRRQKCGWGEWSLVQATLNAIEAAVDAFPRATHFYMVSGDCMAIKTAEYAHDLLDGEDADYIESFDYFESEWIKTGFKEERLIYRHFFNERSQKRLFYWSFQAQRKLGLERKVPEDLQIMIGSQWWCLRRQTIEAVLEFARKRRDVIRFFKTTWIPDETFFQTIVRHLVPSNEIHGRTLTFLMFSDYGMPISFYDDQYDLLLSQDYLFARKISPGAKDLRQRLGDLYATKGMQFTISNEGQSLFKFLTGRGRIGRRFERRFWEKEGSLGRNRTLLLVTCKKWHVAKRLVENIGAVTGTSALEYIFNETNAQMPDLGGIETTVEKRNRHRLSLINMVYEALNTERLLVCLDPSDFDVIKDFYANTAKTRLLEIDCNFTDEYLLGHAMRVGLAGDMTPQRTIDRLLPTIRADIDYETDRIRDAELPASFRIRENSSVQQNARVLEDFLTISPEQAKQLAATNHLFAD